MDRCHRVLYHDFQARRLNMTFGNTFLILSNKTGFVFCKESGSSARQTKVEEVPLAITSLKIENWIKPHNPLIKPTMTKRPDSSTPSLRATMATPKHPHNKAVMIAPSHKVTSTKDSLMMISIPRSLISFQVDFDASQYDFP